MSNRKSQCLCPNNVFGCIGNFLNQPSFASSTQRRSILDGGHFAKSTWPVASVESLFLPHFKLSHYFNSSNYKIARLLSKGGFGAVYEVVHMKTQERWALKILQKSNVLESDCVRQVKVEVEIQRAVGHHSFIASSPHFWQTKPLLFIMFELAEQGDLHEFSIKYGPLPEELCRIYIGELASAIDFLHEAGVIHRDIKPENVLLDSEFHVKLSDFGLAKWLPPGPSHRTYTICGSPIYTAPEVVKGEGYGHSADWWSLGQLACFIHTLKVVENKDEVKSLAAELSKQTTDLLNRLLEPDPSLRIRSFRRLTKIAYYHHFNLNTLTNKQINVKLIIEKFAAAALKDCMQIQSSDQTLVDLEKFDFF